MLASGMLADADELNRKLQQEIIAYQFFHKSEPTLDSISQIMSLLLYGKREFPYYVFTILAGIDRNSEQNSASSRQLSQTNPKSIPMTL